VGGIYPYTAVSYAYGSIMLSILLYFVKDNDEQYVHFAFFVVFVIKIVMKSAY